MIHTVLRTVLFYILIVLCLRLMGKRQVGELQPSELVVAILISELACIPMQDLSSPVTNGVIAIMALVIIELALSALSLKFAPIRRIFSGKPAIVIANGRIDQKMMKRLRYSIDDLLEGLRQDDCFCIEDVEYAILETNGSLSVMMKKSAEPPTRSDMKIKHKECGLPLTVISDGKIQKAALTAHNIPLEKIERQLRALNLEKQDVFLMTLDSNNEFVTVKKES